MISEITQLDELRDLYPLIEEGVARFGEVAIGGYPKIAADIYREVADGLFTLMVAHDEEAVWGWATVTVVTTSAGRKQGRGEDLYIRPGAPSFILNEIFDYCEKHVRANGATSVTFTSPRLAWARRLDSLGYRLTNYVFTKELIS